MVQCEHCRIGRMHQKHLPYLDWFEDELLIVPSAPASICDVCGQTRYEVQFLHRLHTLLESAREPSESGIVDLKQVEGKRRWQTV